MGTTISSNIVKLISKRLAFQAFMPRRAGAMSSRSVRSCLLRTFMSALMSYLFRALADKSPVRARIPSRQGVEQVRRPLALGSVFVKRSFTIRSVMMLM
eukprot:6015381-Heterocapsa_arctica.AAC.1